ncbi:uncharacterized protein LOC122304591 [Carya illinoinensis]|uniref:uncharacterized protein LOC122304591 n=1 Tax=Carya illinoinensis TaxID=32201 RepID=UPI001C720E36|nr:uncharacterized protein LOC122304591 [Carya illinoinensis]
MKDEEFVTSYCARTMEISNKMRFHGEKMDDVTIVEKILRSLTPMFDYVSSLLVHEQKMNRSSTTEEQALKASTSTHFSNSRGRDRDRGKGRGDRGNRDGSRLPKDKEKEAQSNFAKKKEVETLLMVVQANQEPESDVWVMEKGDIEIRTKNGFVETISNVLYIPDLKSNLLSAGQLQENGYVIIIQKGVCEIYDPTREAIVVVQMSSNRLFPLEIKSVQSCLVADIKDPSWLWHFRYDYLSFGGLKTLQQKNMVTGLPQIIILS